MGYKYAVVGAGRQGIAAAYDLAKFGDAESVLLIDQDITHASRAVYDLRKLLPDKAGLFTAVRARADEKEIGNVLGGVNSFISAVPYKFNLELTKTAISVGANMCDLGGNTEIVRKQGGMDASAWRAGISIVPDCGMGPGMNISLATVAMGQIEKPREVLIYDGGLPQKPTPPWNYNLFFDVDGLINEYSGVAYFLRNGKLIKVHALSGLEPFLTEEAGMLELEAFVTSGGLSTMPWTFEGKLERLENKTLRYPGHCEDMRVLESIGLFEKYILRHKSDLCMRDISARDMLGQLLTRKLYDSCVVRDIAIIHVICSGLHADKPKTVYVDLVKRYDEETGLTAMQCLTGWHASIMAILAAEGKIRRGVVPVEDSVPGSLILPEIRRRGLEVKIQEE